MFFFTIKNFILLFYLLFVTVYFLISLQTGGWIFLNEESLLFLSLGFFFATSYLRATDIVQHRFKEYKEHIFNELLRSYKIQLSMQEEEYAILNQLFTNKKINELWLTWYYTQVHTFSTRTEINRYYALDKVVSLVLLEFRQVEHKEYCQKRLLYCTNFVNLLFNKLHNFNRVKLSVKYSLKKLRSSFLTSTTKVLFN